MLTVGSLFSGIGGLDAGLERAGMEVKWQVENNEYCQRVLAKHWPKVKRYSNVRECGSNNLTPVDLICGGFPCQPVSCAGKRKGVNDDRWLWPEFARIIRELRPRWVLAENVPGLLSIDVGRVFGTVLRDLAACGYDAEWDCIPAAAVGAPHIRDRVFLLAHSACIEHNGRKRNLSKTHGRQDEPVCSILSCAGSSTPHLADTGSAGRSGRTGRREQQPESCQSERDVAYADRAWELQPQGSLTAQRRRVGDGGQELSNNDRTGCADIQGQCATSEAHWSAFAGANRREPEGIWSPEPDVGRVADGVPKRVDRLRCLGNAVVPQVAEWIGRRILKGLNDAKSNDRNGDRYVCLPL